MQLRHSRLASIPREIGRLTALQDLEVALVLARDADFRRAFDRLFQAWLAEDEGTLAVFWAKRLLRRDATESDDAAAAVAA